MYKIYIILSFQNVTEVVQLNYEQNMHDAIAVFHKLQTGLDVNVRFNGYVLFADENVRFNGYIVCLIV